MKDNVTETQLIGSGTPEEAQARVNHLLELGTTRGYLTYEELNTKLPDEVVSPDKLDSLLMTIDEMGIKLIDDADVSEFISKNRVRTTPASVPAIAMASMAKITPLKPAKPVLATPVKAPKPVEVVAEPVDAEVAALPEGEEEPAEVEEVELVDLAKELAEVSTKRIDDPVRMYLTQMGEIPLLTREQEISLAKKIEITRKIFRSKVLESDYCLNAAVEILQQVDEGDLPFDRTMKISTAEDQADKATIGQRIPMNLATVRTMLARNAEDWTAVRESKNKKDIEARKLALRRRRRRSVKLLEELSLRTSKVTPLMKKLHSISTKMLELEQRIEEFKKMRDPGEDLEVCQQ